MTVTEIVSLDKRKSKVTLDECFTLVLYKGELRKYKIEEGMELPEGAYQELMEILKKRAKERALHLLESADKTEAQMCRKLEEGGYPKEAVEYAIAFLEKYGFLDDSNYARRYIESYGSRKSRRQIRYDLQQKGIDKQTISDLLEEHPVDEEEQVRTFLRKKGAGIAGMDRKERAKLFAALGRKGFSFDVVNRVLGSLDLDN